MKLSSKIITLSAIALLTAACSSGGGVYSKQKSSQDKAWKTASSSKGQIFTNQSGKSLYTFDKDTSGTSNCYDSCAAAWPPFAASNNAVKTGNWSVVTRKDGSKQWALNGQPLYYFAADKAAGDVRGDGINNVWHLAKTSATASTYTKPSASYKKVKGSSYNSNGY